MVVLLNITSSVCSFLCNKLAMRPSSVNISRIDSPPLICFGYKALNQTAEKVVKLRQNSDNVCQVLKNFWDMANEEPNILMRKILAQQGIKFSREESDADSSNCQCYWCVSIDGTGVWQQLSISQGLISSSLTLLLHRLILSSLAKYLFSILLGWRMC